DPSARLFPNCRPHVVVSATFLATYREKSGVRPGGARAVRPIHPFSIQMAGSGPAYFLCQFRELQNVFAAARGPSGPSRFPADLANLTVQIASRDTDTPGRGLCSATTPSP